MKDNSGYVYILSNPAMPGILKIGRSKNSGRVRAKELYHQGGTGVPMPFKMEFEIWADDCIEAELCAHEELEEFRINISREFFKVELDIAVKHVMSIVGSGFGLSVGNEMTTITEEMFVPEYHEIKEIVETIEPGPPFEITIAEALGYWIDKKHIIEAIQKRRKKIEEKQRRNNEPEIHE